MFLTITDKIQKTKIFSPESFLFCAFILMQMFINTNKLYVILIFIYLCGLYVISRNFLTSAWFAFLSTLLFKQGKFFITTLHLPTSNTILEVPVLYNIMFSDVLLLFVLFLLKRNAQKTRFTRTVHSYELLFVPILIIGVISSWFSYFSDISFFYLIQLIKYFIIFFISSILLKDNKIKKITFEILILFVLFNALLMGIQKFKGGPLGLPIEHLNTWSTLGRFAVEQKEVFRPGGTMDDPNLIASFIGIMFPILIVMSFTRNVFNRWIIWITLLTSGIGLLFTGSRAVWFVCLGIIFLGLYISKRIQLKLVMPTFVTTKNVIRISLLSCFFFPLIFLRLGTLSEAFSGNGSGMYRLRHLTIAKDYLLNYPFGIGLQVFEYVTPMQYEPKEYSYQIAEPHNIFAQIGSELGIVGLVLFCYIFSRIMSHKYKIIQQYRDPLQVGIFLGCISYLGIACFYPWFLYSPLSELFWLLMGVYGIKKKYLS